MVMALGGEIDGEVTMVMALGGGVTMVMVGEYSTLWIHYWM